MEYIELIMRVFKFLWRICIRLALGREGYALYLVEERRKRQLKINRQYSELVMLEAEYEIKQRKLDAIRRQKLTQLKIRQTNKKIRDLKRETNPFYRLMGGLGAMAKSAQPKQGVKIGK